MVVPTYNPSSWEAEVGDCEFEACLEYIARPCKEKEKEKERMKKEGRKEGGRGRTSAMSSKSHMSKAWSPKQ
jgi:hypothetical protein